MAFRHGWTIMLAFCASSAAAIEAPIQSVTLYPGSATVERVVQVSPGMTKVEITGLQANFDTETVRLQADPGIQIGQIITQDQGRADSPSARQADLETRIQSLQDQIASIDADYKSAQLVQAYLERLGASGGTTERAAPIDPKSLPATLDAIRKGASDALERMHTDSIKKRALSKQLDVLKRELAKVQASARDSRVMTVQLSARQAGKLLLSYQVNNAGWKPSYRASLDSNASTVELERLATISQKTGEDWSNVKLRLSTGQPNLSVYAPDPEPWLLNYQPPSERRAREAAPAAPAPAKMAFQEQAAPMPDTADDYVAPVLESQGNFATEFEVPARVSLAADGREISVGLAKQSLRTKQRILISPRTSNTTAVVTAEATRPEGVWLPGQVQLHRDGSYVGAQHWDPEERDQFLFAFGPDPLVRVEVEHRNDKSGQAGFFNQENERRINDTYAVTNLHRQAVDILVLEPTPVSQSDKINVKTALKPEPTVKEWEQRRGLVGWEATLKPNATARFDMDDVIQYPKEGVVQGL